jgi:hypothetical protein
MLPVKQLLSVLRLPMALDSQMQPGKRRAPMLQACPWQGVLQSGLAKPRQQVLAWPGSRVVA